MGQTFFVWNPVRSSKLLQFTTFQIFYSSLRETTITTIIQTLHSWITVWMGDRARFMSVLSTAVANKEIFIPKNRLSPGNREKKPTRVVGKPLLYWSRHILFVVGKTLSHTWVRHHARRYCRRHIRTISFCRHFSCLYQDVTTQWWMHYNVIYNELRRWTLIKFSIALSKGSLPMTPKSTQSPKRNGDITILSTHQRPCRP